MQFCILARNTPILSIFTLLIIYFLELCLPKFVIGQIVFVCACKHSKIASKMSSWKCFRKCIINFNQKQNLLSKTGFVKPFLSRSNAGYLFCSRIGMDQNSSLPFDTKLQLPLYSFHVFWVNCGNFLSFFGFSFCLKACRRPRRRRVNKTIIYRELITQQTNNRHKTSWWTFFFVLFLFFFGRNCAICSTYFLTFCFNCPKHATMTEHKQTQATNV